MAAAVGGVDRHQGSYSSRSWLQNDAVDADDSESSVGSSSASEMSGRRGPRYKAWSSSLACRAPRLGATRPHNAAHARRGSSSRCHLPGVHHCAAHPYIITHTSCSPDAPHTAPCSSHRPRHVRNITMVSKVHTRILCSHELTVLLKTTCLPQPTTFWREYLRKTSCPCYINVLQHRMLSVLVQTVAAQQSLPCRPHWTTILYNSTHNHHIYQQCTNFHFSYITGSQLHAVYYLLSSLFSR